MAYLKNTKKLLLAVMTATVVCTTLFISVPVKADLMILPIRIVFTDRDRMKSVTLANTSEDSATFRMSFYHQKQNTDGSYMAVETPDPKLDLSKMLVYSPRQVDLDSRGKQSVRLSVRRPENLPDGEYRTHLKMTRIPRENLSTPVKGANTAMFINVGFSIPIMLRKGKYDTTVSISDFKYTPALGDGKTQARVDFFLNRKGKYSALGRTLIYWVSPNGKEKQVGIKNGVNVFPEIDKRAVYVVLEDSNISGGKIKVVFEGADADLGIKFDEKSFPI